MLRLTFGFTVMLACLAVSSTCKASPHKGVTRIGGHWFVKSGDLPVYFSQDGERYLDLFSDHAKDSNKDGILNLKLSHDERCLIMESQGYPNHPTAAFPSSGNPNSIRVQKFEFRLPLKPRITEACAERERGRSRTTLSRGLGWKR